MSTLMRQQPVQIAPRSGPVTVIQGRAAGTFGESNARSEHVTTPSQGSLLGLVQKTLQWSNVAVTDAVTTVSNQDAVFPTAWAGDVQGKVVRQLAIKLGVSGQIPTGWTADTLTEELYQALSLQVIQNSQVQHELVLAAVKLTDFMRTGIELEIIPDRVNLNLTKLRLFTGSGITIPAATAGQTYNITARALVFFG